VSRNDVLDIPGRLVLNSNQGPPCVRRIRQ
jgi:hypothetical protein